MDNTSSPRIRIEDLLPENQLSEEEMARIVGAGGPSRAQLGVEELENRELMASQLIASLSKGVLNIEGTKRADTIQLQVRDDRVEVSGTLIRTPNGRVDSIPVDEVARIKINALAGDDRIFMDPDLLQSAKILGGAGNDLLAGGNAAHAMIGGAGVNDIIPASVADVLLAEAAVYKHENGTLFHFAGPNKWVPLGAVDKLIRDEAGRVLTLQGSSLSRANGGQLQLLSDSVKDAVAFGGGPLVLFEDSHLGRWDGNAITSYQNEVANLVGYSGTAGEPEVLVLFRDGTLFRFNGTDSTEPIEAGGPVQALAQSADGFYYVLQGGWLYRYDGSSFHQLADHGGRVQALVEAADGHAYYLSGGTLFRLGINGTASQAIAAGGPVQALVQAADDNAYILQGGTIYRFDGTGFVQIVDHAGLVQQLAPASDGRAYALSGGDLYQFNGTALVEKIYSGGPVHAVVQGADGQAYILAGGWLYRYLGGQNNFVQIPDRGGHIQALAQASDGHAYALSDGDLYRLGVRGVLNEQIYAGGPVEALAQAADGQGYILAGGSLYRYLGGQNNFVQIANNTQALVQGGDGNAYVLSSGVLRRFDSDRLAEAINTGGTVQALGQLGDGKVYFRQDGARFSFAGGNRPEAIRIVTLDQLARSLQQAGLGATAIAAGLKQIGEPDYHAALALHQTVGAPPQVIAQALRTAYGSTLDAVAFCLRNAGMDHTEVARGLKDGLGEPDYHTALALYRSAGASPVQIAVALREVYGAVMAESSSVLHRVSLSLRNAGIDHTAIARALKEGLNEPDYHAALGLYHGAGASPTQIAVVLREVYGAVMAESSSVLHRVSLSLRNAGIDYTAITRALKDGLNEPDYHAALGLYHGAGASPTQIAVALREVYQSEMMASSSVVHRVSLSLHNAGIDHTAIARALKDGLGEPDYHAALGLYQVGVSPTQIAVSLSEVYGDEMAESSLYQIGFCLSNAGVDAQGIAQGLRDGLGKSDSSIAICLKWLELGGQRGSLGLPVGATNKHGDGIEHQDFEYGVIYHSDSTGAHAILGNPNDPNTFWGRFRDAGFERGLGLPIGEASLTSDGVIAQQFERGGIYFSTDGRCLLVGDTQAWQQFLRLGGLQGGLALQGGGAGGVLNGVLNGFLTSYFDPSQNAVGFRIGTSLLSALFGQVFPGEIYVKNTDYNKIYVHHIHFDSVGSDGVHIGFSVRWEKYENIPIVGGTYKRGETNFDVQATVRFFIAADGTIKLDQPVITDYDSSVSGIGGEEILDYTMQSLTFLVTLGEYQGGLFDVYGGMALFLYNFSALFVNQVSTVADPSAVQASVNAWLGFVRTLLGAEAGPGITLQGIRYDPSGVYIVFNYGEWLEPAFRAILPVRPFPT